MTEHTTIRQNRAHRNDIAWVRQAVTVKQHGSEWFVSEYYNPFTGQTIRKSGRMTGRDWFVFSEADEVTARTHSLTFAKLDAGGSTS